MQVKQRRWHALMWLVLAVLLPLLFILALVLRAEPPVNPDQPPAKAAYDDVSIAGATV